MNRRGFFGALAGLVAAFLPSKPQPPLSFHPDAFVLDWSDPLIDPTMPPVKFDVIYGWSTVRNDYEMRVTTVA